LGENGSKKTLSKTKAGELGFNRPEMTAHIKAIRLSRLSH
jgi:hypothetical protein